MNIAFWRDGDVVIEELDQATGTENALWIEKDDGSIICGHDHYWVDDGVIFFVDHHDYDVDGWPVRDVQLPDTVVFDGVQLPDDVWEEVRPW